MCQAFDLAAKKLGPCDVLAHRLNSALHTDHSGRIVIRTTAARSTPNAWTLVSIWPKTMLNNVLTTVAAPINSGMAGIQGLIGRTSHG
jgi:hypothetical protein